MTLQPIIDHGRSNIYASSNQKFWVNMVTSDEPMGTRIAEQSGSGLLHNQITQEWEFAIDPPADIMFSVDASCSMSDNTSQLASNFSSFISQLSNYSTNWQVMVTGGDTGCNIGGVLTPSTPNYATTFQQAVKCKDDFLHHTTACSSMGVIIQRLYYRSTQCD